MHVLVIDDDADRRDLVCPCVSILGDAKHSQG
jgi:hypothetical protein